MNDNLGIGVMSSINFKERYTACKNTWLKDFDNTFIFGGHMANELDSNLISISNAGEDWQSCFLKQQLGLKYMYECNPNFEWYSISGCDNILFKNRVIDELSKFNSNEDLFISQPCGLWNDSPLIHEINTVSNFGVNFRAIAGGASFFISNSLMKKCYFIIDEFNEKWNNISGANYGCADVALSYMLKLYFGVEMTHSPYMLSQNIEHYEGAIMGNENAKWYINYPILLSDAIKTPISLHYIKPIEMEKIYAKYKN